MGRRRESSLGKFEVPCNIMEDEGMKGIIDECGAQAVAVYISVMCAIHSHSYYVELTDDVVAKIAEQTYASAAYVRNVIAKMVSLGIFSSSHYEQYNVLISKDIIERYIKQMKSMRRKLLTGNMPYIHDFEEHDDQQAPEPDKQHDAVIEPPPRDNTRELLNDIGGQNEITQSIMMRYSLDIDTVKNMFEEFCSQCNYLNQQHNDRKDAFYHFINWIRIRRQARSKPPENRDRRRGVEAGVPSPEEYFKPFFPSCDT